jgi:hypothetical protein
MIGPGGEVLNSLPLYTIHFFMFMDVRMGIINTLRWTCLLFTEAQIGGVHRDADTLE